MISVNLKVVKGDVFPYNFSWKYSDGKPVSLVDFELFALIKRSDASSEILDEWTVDNGKIQVLDDGSRCRIYLEPSQTMYDWNSGVWALIVRHKFSSFQKTLVKGSIIVTTGGNLWRRP